MTERINSELRKFRKKIENSSGCNYLYRDFDNIVRDLDEWKKNFSGETDSLDQKELFETIDLVLKESFFSNHNSAGWILYAVRTYYCAFILTRYIVLENQYEEYNRKLSAHFGNLAERGIAALIPVDAFDKYCKKFSKEAYLYIIKNCVKNYFDFRLWNIDEVYVSAKLIELLHKYTHEYTEKYKDFSLYNIWFSHLNIGHFIRAWNIVLEKDFESSGLNLKETERYLSESVKRLLEMFDISFKHDMVNTLSRLSTKDIIEILEEVDDDKFEEYIVTLSKFLFDEKIRKIFLHFINDDEDWDVNLCMSLMSEEEEIRKNLTYDLEWAKTLSLYNLNPRYDDENGVRIYRELLDRIKEEKGDIFGFTDMPSCRNNQWHAIKEMTYLPWEYLYDCMKLSRKDFNIMLPFEIANDLKCHFNGEKEENIYGWFDEKENGIRVFAYTGRSHQEESDGYDGFGRYDKFYEIIEGWIDRNGKWIKRPALRSVSLNCFGT